MELFWEPGEKCEANPTTLRDEPRSPAQIPMEVHGSASDLKERARDSLIIHTKVP